VAAADRRPARRRAAKKGSSYSGKLRIIGGRWRGRRLSITEAEGLRPTPDRVREDAFQLVAAPYRRCSVSIFSRYRCLVPGSLVARCRTGGHGGKDAHVVECLRQHVAILQAVNADVVQADAVDFLRQTPQPFDIIFWTRPSKAILSRVARAGETNGWIKRGGLVYVEAPSQVDVLPCRRPGN
jgi:16S rRNA (guanine966-N2)-methyltransferase